MTNPEQQTALPFETTDITVKTGDAEALDATLIMLPGAKARVVEGSWDAKAKQCVVRVLGPPKFVLWALEHQGYAQIVKVRCVC